MYLFVFHEIRWQNPRELIKQKLNLRSKNNGTSEYSMLVFRKNNFSNFVGEIWSIYKCKLISEPFVSFSMKADCGLIFLSRLFTIHSFHVHLTCLKFRGISIFHPICHHSLLIIIMHNNTFAEVWLPEGKINCNYFRFHSNFAQKLHSFLKLTQTQSLMSRVRFVVCAHFPYGRFPRHRRNIMPLIIHT